MRYEFEGGTIVSSSHTTRYFIEKSPLEMAGKGRVGIHCSMRDGTKRHQIVRLTRRDTGTRAYAAVYGLKPDECDTILKMDLDLRTVFGVKTGEAVEFEIKKANFFGTLWWYLTVNDPVVKASAILALTSVLLGLLSVALALFI